MAVGEVMVHCPACGQALMATVEISHVSVWRGVAQFSFGKTSVEHDCPYDGST